MQQHNDIIRTFTFTEKSSEQGFTAIGLASYFATYEDNNLDWEEVFDVSFTAGNACVEGA